MAVIQLSLVDQLLQLWPVALQNGVAVCLELPDLGSLSMNGQQHAAVGVPRAQLATNFLSRSLRRSHRCCWWVPGAVASMLQEGSGWRHQTKWRVMQASE